ncbi:MAG TPA: hypothetical protein VL635_19165 [Trinickia sp.]|nr:hypothetical protein [Trinickia sp.]
MRGVGIYEAGAVAPFNSADGVSPPENEAQDSVAGATGPQAPPQVATSTSSEAVQSAALVQGYAQSAMHTRMEYVVRRAAADEPSASDALRSKRNAGPSATMSSAAVASTLSLQRASTQRSAAAEAAVLERLIASLGQWIDEDKARAYANRPSDLLMAVAKHRHRAIPEAFSTLLDPSLLTDEAVLDEAAVLYDRLRERAMPAEPRQPQPLTLSTLRTRFVDALRADYAKRRALDALFVPSTAFGQTTPYFDGFALRNGEGMSFDTLVDSKAVWSAPALAALTAPERRALLTEKFDEMAESTQFPIGSIPHSLATALLRMDRYRGAQPSSMGDEAALLQAFVKSEGAWKDGESYPYHPRLMFALHLARSSGVDVVSHEDLRLLFENQVNDPAVESEIAGNGGTLRWIDRHLSQSNKLGSRWREAKPAEQTELLLGLFAALNEAADGAGSVAAFARDLRTKGLLTPNRLVGADFESRAATVLEYANERLLAAYGAAPSFDRYGAAAAILDRCGVDEDARSHNRRYVISGDNPNVAKQAFGDLVDEFLDRADWVGLNGAWMTLPTGARLKPRDELQRSEEAFNASLPSNAWVVATAKVGLRRESKPVTPDSVRHAADEIVGRLATETESHRALMRGLETWINMVPVAGPVYNIEEGVRHHDAARAAFGLLFLGADLFDVSAGAGGASRDAVHPVVPKLRRVAVHVDGSSVNRGGHPDMIEMTVDPVHIGRRDAGVPDDLRPLARRVREGASVRWRDYDVVHLDAEDRIVPIRRDGERYVEVDWRTGHRLREAPHIELDPRAGRTYRQSGRGHENGRASLDGDVRERPTVEGVTRLFERANDATVRDFDTLFADAFALASPVPANASKLKASAFYRKVYESSGTFRRLFNRHAELDARARNATASPWKRWEFVIGQSAPLGSPRKAYTDFEHKRIYLPDDAGMEAMPYMSAGGPRAMSPEQAYLGEMVRALTGARDPAAGLDLTNRGPAAYLTGKILSEAGYDVPEQIMFRAQNARPDMPTEQTVEYHMDAAARGAELENRYLDRVLDAGRGAVTAKTLVDGVPVASRLTVSGTKASLDAIEGADDEVFLPWSDFKTKFHQNFGFYVQDRTMTRQLASDAMVVLDFYGRLYQRSVTFRRMFDEMPVTEASQADPWKFVLEGDIEFDLLSPTARERAMNEPAKKIYVLDDGMRYLTESGLREVEIERALTDQMIRAITGLQKLPPAQAIANRGPAVYLTDKILLEAGFNYPRQLAAALAGPGDAAAQARLLAQQTSAMRSAATEDQYMMLS